MRVPAALLAAWALSACSVVAEFAPEPVAEEKGPKPEMLSAVFGAGADGALSPEDHALAAEAANTALETFRDGLARSWANRERGTRGAFTPIRTYQEADGTHCRDFSASLTLGRKLQRAYGKACRNADATWNVRERAPGR